MPAGVLMVLFALYFLIIEFLKMRFVEYRTKSDVSIYLMISFHLLNLTTFALNFVEGKKVADEEFYGKLDPYMKNKYVFGIIYMLYTLIITQIMLKVLINLLHHFYE